MAAKNKITLSYEQAIDRIEGIVAIFEDNSKLGDIVQMVELYDEATRLIDHCTQILNGAELKFHSAGAEKLKKHVEEYRS